MTGMMLVVFNSGQITNAKIRSVNVVEHNAQTAFHFSGSTIAQDLTTNMAHENGAVMSSGGNALMALNTAKWLAFTNSYEGNQRNRIRDVTLDSRDRLFPGE